MFSSRGKGLFRYGAFGVGVEVFRVSSKIRRVLHKCLELKGKV